MHYIHTYYTGEDYEEGYAWEGRYFMDIVVKMKFVDDGEEIKNYIN